LGELPQLVAAQLSIAVRVKSHRIFDHAIGIARPLWAAGTAAAAPLPSNAATLIGGPITVVIAIAPIPITPAGAAIAAGTTGPAVAIRSQSAGPATAARSAPTAKRAGGAQFVFGEDPIPVFIQRFERRRRAGELFGRNLAVVVLVDHIEQKIRRRPSSTSGRSAASWTPVLSRGTVRRLRKGNSHAQ
jgi:hypothetical protein